MRGGAPPPLGYAAAFGRRPRRAAARPGILLAQESQRSACREPRRASEKFSRIVAPLPSPTSLPHASHTRTVLRAKVFPPSKRVTSPSLIEKADEFYAASRARRIHQDRSRLSKACSSGSRPISRAETTRKCRGRKSSMVLPSRYCSMTAGLTYELRATAGVFPSCSPTLRITAAITRFASASVSATPRSAKPTAASSVPPQVRKSLAVGADAKPAQVDQPNCNRADSIRASLSGSVIRFSRESR